MRAGWNHGGVRGLVLTAGLALACGRGGAGALDATVTRVDVVDEDREEAVDATPVDTGPSFVPPTKVIALVGWTPVRSAPDRASRAEGYLRSGAVVDVVDGPHGRNGCVVHRDHPEGGWYRVAGGGYVCVGGNWALPWPARHTRGYAPPSLDAAVPYTYAINYGRTIMYRRLPSMDDLRQHEPWRFPQPDAGTPPEGEGATAETASATQNQEARHGSRDRDRDRDRDQERSRGRLALADLGRDSGIRRRDIRMDDLAGERGGVMVRRMLSGMYVALDRVVQNRAVGESYWHTQSGGYVRSGRLSVWRSIPTLQGVVIDAQHPLPVAWMVSTSGWTYRPTATGRAVSFARRVPRLGMIQLSSEPSLTVGTQEYYRTPDGLAVKARNVRRAALRAPPAGVGPDERWIDVDLDEQVLVAYEGARPVYAALISSGRKDGGRHAEDRFETPAGSFRIAAKHVSNTMDGDTASDGPYSIEDVPWVMYFHDSYALHGAFWHNYFGWRMSHGCVNLAPNDARWIFHWAAPQLPAGWHGVYASEHRPGSRVELRHSRNNAREEGRPAEAEGRYEPR